MTQDVKTATDIALLTGDKSRVSALALGHSDKQAIRKQFENRVAGYRHYFESDGEIFMPSLQIPAHLVGVCSLAVAASGGMAAVIGVPVALAAFAIGAGLGQVNAINRGTAFARAEEELPYVRSAIASRLQSLQQYSVSERQQEIVKLIEGYLAGGGLLSLALKDESEIKEAQKEEWRMQCAAAGYLANIPKEIMAQASDQLVITALQLRAVINSDKGGAEALQASCFRLDLRHEEHRALLREKLLAAHRNAALGEQADFPRIQLPDYMEHEDIKNLEVGVGGRILRAIAAPLFIYHDKKAMNRVRNMEIPDWFFTDVQTPALRGVEDIGGKVRVYEQKAGVTLDLPAIRGWKGARAVRKIAPPR